MLYSTNQLELVWASGQLIYAVYFVSTIHKSNKNPRGSRKIKVACLNLKSCCLRSIGGRGGEEKREGKEQQTTEKKRKQKKISASPVQDMPQLILKDLLDKGISNLIDKPVADHTKFSRISVCS